MACRLSIVKKAYGSSTSSNRNGKAQQQHEQALFRPLRACHHHPPSVSCQYISDVLFRPQMSIILLLFQSPLIIRPVVLRFYNRTCRWTLIPAPVHLPAMYVWRTCKYNSKSCIASLFFFFFFFLLYVLLLTLRSSCSLPSSKDGCCCCANLASAH